MLFVIFIHIFHLFTNNIQIELLEITLLYLGVQI